MMDHGLNIHQEQTILNFNLFIIIFNGHNQENL